jgi:acetyl-CoA carboxylase carboxyltransferase component
MAAAPARAHEVANEAAYGEPDATRKGPRKPDASGARPRIAVLEPAPRMTPLERLEELLDEGSFQPLRTAVRSRRMGEKARDGDGVLAGHGRVAGKPVCCYAQDGSFAGGSLGEVHADSIVEVLRLAGRAKVPIVGFIESAGARMQEGLAALSGYGRIFREHVALSGRVPQISVVCGPSAGGACYGPALTDFVIMSSESAMFLTGPSVISEVTGEQIDIPTLGGPRVHERNGVCHLTTRSDGDAARLARELLAHLPQHRDERPAAAPSSAPARGAIEEIVPGNAREVYDVRDVIDALVDAGSTLEISPRFARNVVCSLARLHGRAIGVIANQPRHLGGVLDVDASQKAARFVRTCNAFGLPLLVLVDTPGFLPGSKQERDGVIRHGAKLVHAFAEASVPSVTVVLRKAFGGAFIAMNSKALGADRVFAWRGAELGVMGAGQAVGILNRREIAAAAEPTAARDVFAASYAAEHLHVEGASADGFVDEVIERDDTRRRVDGAFELLERSGLDALATGNIPL